MIFLLMTLIYICIILHPIGLLSQDSEGQNCLQREIPCPECLFNISSTINLTDLLSEVNAVNSVHAFTYESCALAVIQGSKQICCEKTGVKLALDRLIPELVMADLPPNLLIDPTHLQLDYHDCNTILGRGAFGTVLQAQLNNVVVAAKMTILPDVLDAVRAFSSQSLGET